jgi:hypothetical protein
MNDGKAGAIFGSEARITAYNDALELRQRYEPLLNALFEGRVPDKIPWEDPRFRTLFANRMNEVLVRLQDARNWDSIKELANTIGRAMK